MRKRKRSDNYDSDSDNDEELSSRESDEIQPYYDSDALDEDSDSGTRKLKANRDSSRKKPTTKKGGSTRSPLKKHRKPKPKDDSDEDQEEEFGGEVVGVIVKAPETGRGEFFPVRPFPAFLIKTNATQSHQVRYPRTLSTS